MMFVNLNFMSVFVIPLTVLGVLVLAGVALMIYDTLFPDE